MTITEIIYNTLIDFNLSVPEIWAGVADSSVKVEDGLLSFFPLPSSGLSFADPRSDTQYQFDVWAQDMYEAESFKEEALYNLLGWAEIRDGFALIFTIESDSGGLYEQDTNLWHYSFTVNVHYTRREN